MRNDMKWWADVALVILFVAVFFLLAIRNPANPEKGRTVWELCRAEMQTNYGQYSVTVNQDSPHAFSSDCQRLKDFCKRGENKSWDGHSCEWTEKHIDIEEFVRNDYVCGCWAGKK